MSANNNSNSNNIIGNSNNNNGKQLFLRVKRRRRGLKAEGEASAVEAFAPDEPASGQTALDPTHHSSTMKTEEKEEEEQHFASDQEDRLPKRMRLEQEDVERILREEGRHPDQQEGNDDQDEVLLLRCPDVGPEGGKNLLFRKLKYKPGAAPSAEEEEDQPGVPKQKSAKTNVPREGSGTTRARNARAAIKQRTKLRCERITRSRKGLTIHAHEGGEDGDADGEGDGPSEWVTFVADLGETETFNVASYGSQVATTTLDDLDLWERQLQMGLVVDDDFDDQVRWAQQEAPYELVGVPNMPSWQELYASLGNADDEEDVNMEDFVLDHDSCVQDELRRVAEVRAEANRRKDDDHDSNSSANDSHYDYDGIDDDEDLGRKRRPRKSQYQFKSKFARHQTEKISPSYIDPQSGLPRYDQPEDQVVTIGHGPNYENRAVHDVSLSGFGTKSTSAGASRTVNFDRDHPDVDFGEGDGLDSEDDEFLFQDSDDEEAEAMEDGWKSIHKGNRGRGRRRVQGIVRHGGGGASDQSDSYYDSMDDYNNDDDDFESADERMEQTRRQLDRYAYNRQQALPQLSSTSSDRFSAGYGGAVTSTGRGPDRAAIIRAANARRAAELAQSQRRELEELEAIKRKYADTDEMMWKRSTSNSQQVVAETEGDDIGADVSGMEAAEGDELPTSYVEDFSGLNGINGLGGGYSDTAVMTREEIRQQFGY